MFYSYELADGKTMQCFSSDIKGASPHWHESYELMFIEEGCIMYYLENEANPFYLEAGSIVLLKPNILHTPAPVSDTFYKIHEIAFIEYEVYSMLQDLGIMTSISPGYKAVIPSELIPTVGRMMDCFSKINASESQDDINLLRQYINFLLALIKKYRVIVPESSAIKPVDDQYMRIRLACRYIEEHPEENPTPSALAQIANYSLSHFFRLFREVVGCSIHDYISRVKIRTAQKLLRDGEYSVTEISYRLGFSHPNNFSRTYKRITGKNPRDDKI